MHTLLLLSTIAAVAVSTYWALCLLRTQANWSSRRLLQFLVLVLPVGFIVIGLAIQHHFATLDCFLSAPTWDYIFTTAFPVCMLTIAASGLVFGLLRMVLLHRMLARRPIVASTALQTVCTSQANKLGISAPQLHICVFNRPLAMVYGIHRSTILLSTWMLSHLDQQEIEAVISHELGHIARRDYVVIWIATMLRDGFFYLPMSWTAYRQIQREKEFACDAFATQLTKRPLALASALAKVWQHGFSDTSLVPAQSLLGRASLTQERIERLLIKDHDQGGAADVSVTSVRIGASVIGLFLLLQLINMMVFLTPMGCGPVAWVWANFR